MSDKALIIQPISSDRRLVESLQLNENIQETEGLARAIELVPAYTHVQKLTKALPSHLFGKGMRENIQALINEYEPEILIVNAALSPIQQRNLETAWKCKVIDRTALILEIFGARAQTKEGRIQVDLAALSYQRSRLVRSWTHLERQRGGAGFMGGPGETQIEIDRRLIADRISKLKKELKKVRQNRELQRKSRAKVPYPVVALVGYTNAGKSTLFNLLTGADVFAEDLPFATLDPTMRALKLESGAEIILSDTVGFISNLPTQLIEAFRATLEQVTYADIIVHVRDIASEHTDQQKQDVLTVLKEMGIEEHDSRIIEIWNKIDRLESQEDFPDHISAVSAISGAGCEGLLDKISDKLNESKIEMVASIPASDGRAISWIHQNTDVIEEVYNDDSVSLRVRMGIKEKGQFEHMFKTTPFEKV